MSLYEFQTMEGMTFMVDSEWTPSNVGPCKGCGRFVLWVTMKTGRKMPVNANGTSHFTDCPQASRFRKQREEPPFPGMP